MDKKYFIQRSIGLLCLLILLISIIALTQGPQAAYSQDKILLFGTTSGSGDQADSTYTISGRVVDLEGNPMPGVEICCAAAQVEIMKVFLPMIMVNNNLSSGSQIPIIDSIDRRGEALQLASGETRSECLYTAITDENGDYMFSGLPSGTYQISPVGDEVVFDPASRTVTLPPNQTDQDFTSQKTPIPTPTQAVPTPTPTVIPPEPDEMVFVPAGEFQMGCHPDHNYYLCWRSVELPLHTVYLDAYYIDKNHVTNAQYIACVDDGACTEPSFSKYNNSIYTDHPVVFVTWHQANTYCEWAGKSLPTEAQWEKAARGETVKAFPWGDEAANCNLANTRGCIDDTSPVGSYPLGASEYGALDMAGNVYDWVKDWYSGTEYEDRACGTGILPPCDNPTGPASGTRKVWRGGSWYDPPDFSRVAFRGHGSKPSFVTSNRGFRCVSPAP